jgi:hypothetical protein
MIDATKHIVPGRNCDGCAMCCKILAIEALNKPKSVWCQHCSTKQSCDIYEQRPTECGNFYCGYLTQPQLGDEWKPTKSKIVLVAELGCNRIAAYVDPARPDAWRKEPYYSMLKMWAEAAVPHRGQVVVCVGQRYFMIFPDRDIDLGIVTPDHRIITGEQKTPSGIRLEAFVMHKDDPRLQQGLVEQSWNIGIKE